MAEQRLWAPWRLDYIKGPKPGECIFCTKPAAGDDRASYIVSRGAHCFAMLNAYPYNNGHLMISPYEHLASVEQLEGEVLVEVMQLTQRCLGALRDAYAPEGFNIGVNEGRAAGAGFDDHVHLHVVPRWGGDTNYMPAIAGTRVLPESLDASYEAIRGALAAE